MIVGYTARIVAAFLLVVLHGMPAAVVADGKVSLDTRQKLSDRTLAVGIEVDRRGARLVGYTLKRQPYLDSKTAEEPRAYVSGERVQIQVALLDQGGRRHVRRHSVGPLCFDHEPGMEPHIEGDVIRLHRDSFIVELPELPGFDRIEVAYHSSFRGTTELHDLGAENLDRARYRASGGTLRYEDLAFAESSEAAEAQGSSATVLWPEDFDDPDLIRIDGDPTEGDRRLNIVIVPDGYTYSNKALMEQHADELIAYLRQTTPNQQHDVFVNYTLVYAYSVENGTDQCDCGTVVDTAMGTRFPYGNGVCGSSANRCLSYGFGCDDPGTDNIVAAELRAPFQDETIIMVNTNRYGGCAGSRATYSAGNVGGDVGTHELGHTVAGLADEYVQNTGCGSSGGEVNTSTNPTEGAWPEWITDLGAPYEGARYWSQCIYRPEQNCKMRSLYQPFCAVCTQRWSLIIFGHPRVSPTAPIESASSAPAQLLIDTRVGFSVTTRFAQGAGVTDEIRWLVQGPSDLQPVEVATGTQSYTHVFDELGQYTVSCEVVADTNFIKPEKYGANRDVVVWEIESVATVCEIGCADGIPECDADNDGLGDPCDPCPGETLNSCFGPVAVDNTALVDIRINTDSTSSDACNGPKTDCRGRTWIADFGAPESTSGYNVAGDPITCDLDEGCPVDATGVFSCSDTATEELFRCGHQDPLAPPDLAYAFDVPDGDYLVNLLFMNASTATESAGERVFSVAIDGVVPVQLAQFDPVVAAGGACDPSTASCLPVNRSTVVEVSGGTGLTLEFLEEVDRPLLMGVEVLCATSTWYRDADGDGYGNANDELVTCYKPAGYVLDGTDCNDANATAHPEAPETCDGVDNNCDEAVDEDLDGDGFAVCADCDEMDPCRWAIPGEVLNVRWSETSRLVFDPPADAGGSSSRYSGLRSANASNFTSAECLPASPQLDAVIDDTVPNPEEVLYYLVRANSRCGPGPLGSGTEGLPRQGPLFCSFVDDLGCGPGRN
jgi:hypothetical protein